MRDAPICGSLFSGAGLLDAGLAMAGFEHAWVCESDEFRRGLLARRFPGAVVYDDIRILRGGQAAADVDEPRTDAYAAAGGSRSAVGKRAMAIDLIAGGFPCKGASSAGKQNGFEHAETVLWHEMRRVIGELQPRYVLIENVANILGMAAAPGLPAGSLWGTVLGDLAALGFDVVWDCVPAAAVGAPHLRDRVFAVATQSVGADAERDGGQRGRADGRTDVAGSGGRTAADAGSVGRERRPGQQGKGRVPAERRETSRDARDGSPASAKGVAVDWGDYRPAITRWEAIHGPAPEPLVRRLDDGDAKLRRVRARVDRSRLSALGDGVHVYCGWLVGLAIREHMRTGRWGP